MNGEGMPLCELSFLYIKCKISFIFIDYGIYLLCHLSSQYSFKIWGRIMEDRKVPRKSVPQPLSTNDSWFSEKHTCTGQILGSEVGTAA